MTNMSIYKHLLTFLLTIMPVVVFSKNYYVDAKASDMWPDGTATSPVKTINDGINLMSSDGGDILIIRPGNYSEDILSVQNGEINSYNIIKAEKDGTVILTGEFYLPFSTQYVQFEGLKWDSHHTKAITGHHIKFLRCAFKGGPAKDNTVNVGIGSNDQSPGAHHILIEDSWAYGLGGRYNFLIYNSDSVVFRRVIARHDGGWQGSGYDPEAGITVYNSSNIEIQNSIVLDSDLKYQYWESAFYNVKNESSQLPYKNTRIVGSIALNTPVGNAYSYDAGGVMNNTIIENSVAWKSGGGIALNGNNKSVTAKNLTLGEIIGTGIAIWGGDKNRLSLSNSILYKNKNKAIRINAGHASLNKLNCYPKKYSPCGSHPIFINPVSHGLKYIPVINKKSKLHSLNIGANITNQTGKSGTLYNDKDFNITTDISLWPWPYENRIKNDLCENTKRGLCSSSKSLTDYIWSYLGFKPPNTIYAK